MLHRNWCAVVWPARHVGAPGVKRTSPLASSVVTEYQEYSMTEKHAAASTPERRCAGVKSARKAAHMAASATSRTSSGGAWRAPPPSGKSNLA